jgi:starch phosphorylase
MTGQTFPLRVIPRLPEKIERLGDLASNFWFSWHRPTRRLFFMLDRELWWEVGRNPKVFLRCVDQGVLDMAAQNETFLGAYRQVLAEFDTYHEQGLDGYPAANLGDDDLVAYFCAEYGYHESFPIYSGGLGILAGDHCKTASDVRLPFVAVGLLYRRGYFSQRIDQHGGQVAEYVDLEAANTPVRPLLDGEDQEIKVACQFPGRSVVAKVWRADVGRVPVLLLDTDIPDNDAADREISRVLYGGDSERRLQQEIVLGMGGVKALRAASMAPAVWHVNEGHAAFQLLERIREKMHAGLSFDAAFEAVAANTVFTTHTPVLAGHDIFPQDLLLSYFADLIKELGVAEDAFFSLGNTAGHDGGFDMTRLAISGARAFNAVSRIHAKVSSELCADMWPEIPPAENPVGYVTNGVHVPTFIEEQWADLLEESLGPVWRYQLMDQALMSSIMEIPDGRFWYVNQRVKSGMITALRDRLERQYARNRLSESHVRRVLRYMDPDNPNILTIGFARRFATYKRATLLFNNLDWLREIVDKDEQPVVFLFAGKAHPADEPGQQMLREIQRVANTPGFIGKVLLIEGYDMGLGRLLTAGVDIWLNTPTYPLEASGTSGIKAAINGTVNLSVLDGWWAEAYDGENGWAIPPAGNTEDEAERDRQDARTLYEILQDNVIPLYYDRADNLGYSPGWVEICKRSMTSVLPHFNSHRVVHDYACCFYGPAAERGKVMSADDYAAARQLSEWKKRIAAAWSGVSLRMATPGSDSVRSDEALDLEVEVELGSLQPKDVRVECVLHRLVCSDLAVPMKQFAADARTADGIRHHDEETVAVVPLRADSKPVADGRYLYRLQYQSSWCGSLSYQIRAVPQHFHLSHAYEMGLMRWL